jgi:predicted transcriptional regulator
LANGLARIGFGWLDKTLLQKPKNPNRRNPNHNCGDPMKNPDSCSGRDLCEHRRGRHDIIMSILAAAQKGEILTKIIEKANLNSAQADAYLTELESRNFLSKHRMQGKKSIVWKTTSKGLTLIDACQKCAHLADKPT